MPRFPLSETSTRWGIVIVPLVFVFVWLFNAYKLGQLNMIWYKNMSEHQRKSFQKVAITSVIGAILILLIPLIIHFF